MLRSGMRDMRRGSLLLFFTCALVACALCFGLLVKHGLLNRAPFQLTPRLTIKQIFSSHDENHNGMNDTADIIVGARAEVKRAPTYRSAYYSGGFPPDTEGVCSDVIWRAFRSAGYDLKALVDTDIQKNLTKYPRTNGEPDPNIDFRRVPNLQQYFLSHATVLTTDISPGDVSNLTEWQGGDIVVFGAPTPHIGIISNIRRPDGIPYLIHNAGSHPREEDALVFWKDRISPIVAHVRWPKETVQPIAAN